MMYHEGILDHPLRGDIMVMIDWRAEVPHDVYVSWALYAETLCKKM